MKQENNKLEFSERMWSFICTSDNPIADYLFRYFSSRHQIYKKLFTAEEINYLTFRNDGTISFLPKGKPHLINHDGTWKREGRQNGKAGKVIRKIVSPLALKYGLFKDKDFESFSNMYNAEFSTENMKMELLDNRDIPDVYLEQPAKGDGSLNNSCMQNKGEEEWFDIYKYCKDLQILVLRDGDNNLHGRALVWNLPEYDMVLMDRVYVVKDFYTELFFDYAKEKGWWRKAKQSYDYKAELIDPKGYEKCRVLTISLDTDYNSYPYIDTFTYGKDGALSNDIDDGFGVHEYAETGGERNDENVVWDELNQCNVNIDYAVLIQRGRYRDYHINESDAVRDVDGLWWWDNDSDLVYINNQLYCIYHNDIVFDSLNDTYIHNDDAVSVDEGEYAGDYIPSDESVQDVHGNIWWEDDDDIEEIDGKWWPKDELVEVDGDYYTPDSDEIEFIDGEYKLKQYEEEA